MTNKVVIAFNDATYCIEKIDEAAGALADVNKSFFVEETADYIICLQTLREQYTPAEGIDLNQMIDELHNGLKFLGVEDVEAVLRQAKARFDSLDEYSKSRNLAKFF